MKNSFYKLAVLVFVLGAGLNHLEETRLQKSNQLSQIVLEAPSVKEIKHKEEDKQPSHVTNALFVGSTAELQRLLKGNG